MPTRSAGLLVYRRDPRTSAVEVLLAHPGGPLWASKDAGAWSIPKGELDPADPDPRHAAAREFAEELGCAPPAGEWLALGEVVQAGGKRVVAWGVEGDLDVARVVSGTFEMEWPPRSGRRQRFPEVDRAAWFEAAGEARRRLLPGQLPLLERLLEAVEPR